jgi:hypothetical protein
MAILYISIYATPITLNDTGLITKLEKFTPICIYYGKIMQNPQYIKKQCKKYKIDLDNILKIGYKLDKNIVSKTHTHLYNGKMHSCTEQSLKETSYDSVELNNYRKKLLNLEKFREQIIEHILREKVKARRAYNIPYHEKLIRKDIIKIYEDDKIFIREHRDAYLNNPRYIQMMKDEDEILLSQKEREYLAAIRKEEERKKEKEHARWMKMCGYKMTAERHYAKEGGKISGEVIGADTDGYFVKTVGGYGATYYVVGGPIHTRGEYISTPIFVKSEGEVMPSLTTDTDSGVKVSEVALKVYYNDQCYDR